MPVQFLCSASCIVAITRTACAVASAVLPFSSFHSKLSELAADGWLGIQKHSSLPLPKAAGSPFLSSFSEPATPAKIEGSLAARHRAQQPESYSTSLMYVAASPPCQSYDNRSPQQLSAFSMPTRHIFLRMSGFLHAEVLWSMTDT